MTDLRGVRQQLTLFVPEGAAPWLEPLRQQVDPVQSGLIAAHVTLCREDEIADLAPAALRCRLTHAAPLTLVFGPARRFGGHGMLLPCVDGAAAFQQLRVLALDTSAIRAPEAHLTLAHPRNPRAAANVDGRFGELPARLTITFREVARIEQRDGQPWVVREALALTGSGEAALGRA